MSIQETIDETRDEVGATNDIISILDALEVIRGYGDYVPGDVKVEKPERERFNDAVDNAVRRVVTSDPEDIAEFRAAMEES